MCVSDGWRSSTRQRAALIGHDCSAAWLVRWIASTVSLHHNQQPWHWLTAVVALPWPARTVCGASGAKDTTPEILQTVVWSEHPKVRKPANPAIVVSELDFSGYRGILWDKIQGAKYESLGYSLEAAKGKHTRTKFLLLKLWRAWKSRNVVSKSFKRWSCVPEQMSGKKEEWCSWDVLNSYPA